MTADKPRIATVRTARSLRRPPRSVPSRYLLELLHQRQYEQLARLVREFTETAASGSGQTTADLLQAASWVCEACIGGHREAGWHEEALSQLSNREQELVGMLGRLLSVLEDVAADALSSRGSEPSE